MQSDKLKAFKNEMRNYHYYKKRVKSLESLIELCYSMLPGSVRGIDYSKIPSVSLSNKELEYRIRNEIEHHEKNKRRTQDKIDFIDEILGKIENDIREPIIAVYIDSKKMSDEAQKIYISTNTLQYRMNKALEGALDE